MDKHTAKSMKSYNRKAKNYENTTDYKFTKKLKYDFINYLLKQNIDNKKILDVACGNGDLLNELYKQKLIIATGVDIAESMIQEANKLHGSMMTFLNTNAENILVEDGTQDIAIICCSFHHMSNPKKVLSEINRVLKNNGYLYIADFLFPPIINGIFNKILYPLFNAGDVKMYTKREIEIFCANTGFVIEDYDKIDMKSYIAKLKKSNV